MREVRDLIEKLVNLELKKEGSLPWYLATVFLKLNPGEPLYYTGSSILHEYIYNNESEEIEFQSWCITAEGEYTALSQGSLAHLPIAITDSLFYTELPKII